MKNSNEKLIVGSLGIMWIISIIGCVVVTVLLPSASMYSLGLTIGLLVAYVTSGMIHRFREVNE